MSFTVCLVGMGAMAEVATIVSRIQLALEDINDITQAETG